MIGNLRKIIKLMAFLPKKALLVSIRLYQRLLSPDHGVPSALFPDGYCRFYPSCSEYGYQAVEKYGIIRGLWRSIGRILRCNPWNKGGIDEVC